MLLFPHFRRKQDTRYYVLVLTLRTFSGFIWACFMIPILEHLKIRQSYPSASLVRTLLNLLYTLYVISTRPATLVNALFLFLFERNSLTTRDLKSLTIVVKCRSAAY